jgi:membrane protease YdiL (CAAX protease family)
MPTDSPDDRSRAVRATIWTYLACTFGLSSIFYVLIIRDGHLAAAHGLYVLGLMWCPGVAALLTCAIRGKPVSSLGWKWKWRYQWLSYLIPIGYALAAYLVVWATGLGGVPNWKVVDALAKNGALSGLSRPALLVVFVLSTGTLGMITSIMSALGEEIGWRGLLVPELAKVTTFTKTALISGAIWTMWHVPILVFADYNNGTPVWYGLTCFAVLVMSISFLFAWMRLRSGSLWTGAVLHASHNLVIQGILTPLTLDTGKTKYFIDEFGCALAISALVVAYLVWRRRADVSTAHAPAVVAGQADFAPVSSVPTLSSPPLSSVRTLSS